MNRRSQEFRRIFFGAALHSLDLLVTKIGLFTFGASASYSMEQAAQAHRLPERMMLTLRFSEYDLTIVGAHS
jgi:hypothetical protein